MAYSKKEKYPSIKTPGVYADIGTDKQLGLDNDDLENFSLGNWNSIYKGNKLLLSGNLLDLIKNRNGAQVRVRTTPPKHGDRVLYWRYQRNVSAIGGEYDENYSDVVRNVQGPFIETLADYEEIFPGSGNETNNDVEGLKRSRFERTVAVYERFYGTENITVQRDGGDGDDYFVKINEATMVDEALNFNDDFGTILEREDNNSTLKLVLSDESKQKLNFHWFERAISENERNQWGSGAAAKGRDTIFTNELIVVVNFDIQAENLGSDLEAKFSNQTWNESLPRGGQETNNGDYPNDDDYFDNYVKNSAIAITLLGFENRSGYDGPNNESENFPFVPTITDIAAWKLIPNFYDEDPYNGGFGYYHVDNGAGFNVGAVKFHFYGAFQPNFVWPEELSFNITTTVEMRGVRSLLDPSITQAWDEHFNFIGYPTFQLPIAIDDFDYVSSLNSFDTPVDFIVNAKTENGTELLYYDFEDNFDDYIETSYPVNVKVSIGLLENPAFSNNDIPLDTDDIVAGFGGGGTAAREFLNDENGINLSHFANNPQLCYYRYQVIQWGDEKQLLSNEQIRNSYFFDLYEKDEYPNPGDFFYRKYQQSQQVETISVTEELEHSYNTPGIKTIKIILYRYHPNTAFILQTYLITKNVVVNDGLLKSQDFSIFGGSDFNFLPISDNQVIVGGFDDDSKYNNSVEQLVKDDLFTRDEFLDRISSKDFIDRFNAQLLGKSISQMDVGSVRMFNKPKDIYDFIGGNRLEWISEGSGSLPLNSLATDIFINNDDCVVDLNPAESEYLAIENKFGIAKGILVGDYKLIKTEGAPVIKQGSMETPEIDKNKDRQAF